MRPARAMFLLLLALFSARSVVALAGFDPDLPLAPLYNRPHSDEFPVINNSYIVVFKDDTTADVHENHLDFLQAVIELHPLRVENSEENGVQDVYYLALKGYTGYFSDHTLYQIRTRPEVKYIEPDRVMKTQALYTQRWAPWGLSRISHRKIGGGEQQYTYDVRAGFGTCSYVIDSGIEIAHFELKRNAVWGTTTLQGEDQLDHTGHGTHVAGIMGSNTFGVAKRTKLIAVKVFGKTGNGQTSYTVSGLEWVIRDKATRQGCDKGSVINMSLISAFAQPVHDATNSATQHGIHTVVAAGNFGQDSCTYSPANTPSAITVGATDVMDVKWSGSNWGKCVDIFAPGVNINSTYPPQRANTLTGTSMASPFVAGLVAYLLSLHPDTGPKQAEFGPEFPAEEPLVQQNLLPDLAYKIATQKTEPWTTDAMQAFLIQISTPNVIKSLNPDTVNRLAFNNAGP